MEDGEPKKKTNCIQNQNEYIYTESNVIGVLVRIIVGLIAHTHQALWNFKNGSFKNVNSVATTRFSGISSSSSSSSL